MNTTLFLTQFWGWMMVILGVLFLLKKPSTLTAIFRLEADKTFVATSVYLSIILGLITVLLHNVWIWVWPGILITLFGWIALIKGIVRIGFPQATHQVAVNLEHKPNFIRILLVVMIVLGVWLIWTASKVAGL